MNINSEEEEELPEPELTCVLVVGRSNTGKTNLVRAFLREFQHFDKVTYVLNDRTKDWPYKHVYWPQIQDLANCQLVVEDVIGANTKQYRQLQELLCFRAHHAKVNPIFVISHSLHRQNLTGLIPFFTHVSISAFVGNMASLKNLLTYFGYEKEEKEKYKQMLLECTTPFSHMILNVQKMTMEIKSVELVPKSSGSKSASSAIATKKAEARKTEMFEGKMMTKKDALAHASAARFLSDKLVKNSKKARALFALIYAKLPKKSIDAETLSMTLRKANGRGKTTVSLIDYVATLVDHSKEPTDTVAKFHQYCIKQHNINLPTVFLVNKRFW